ncbi:MAG: hypothetical protein NC093_08490 [Alistipes sp.]|nr:hypothetical protein [Alistipes sp.]
MKKILLACAVLLYTCIASGCKGSESAPDDEKLAIPYTHENVTVPVCNINGEEITHITHYGKVSLTDEGIFYTSYYDEDTMNYYYYKFDSGETSKVGEIKNFAYEAAYDRKMINGHLYTFVTTGGLADSQNRVLRLYDFDLESGSCVEIYSQPGGFPYALMGSFGDDLIILKDENGEQSIEMYDTDTNTFESIARYKFDNDIGCGDAVRKISTDGETVTILRVSHSEDDDVALFLDIYDSELNFVSDLEISDLFSETDCPEGEMRQGCSDLFFDGNVLYYENFCCTRLFGEISENDFAPFIPVDDFFNAASSLTNNMRHKLFYNYGTNSIYVYDMADNSVDNIEFYDINDKYYIFGSGFNSKNDVLIMMEYFDPDTRETLPDKLYLTNLSELSEL